MWASVRCPHTPARAPSAHSYVTLSLMSPPTLWLDPKSNQIRYSSIYDCESVCQKESAFYDDGFGCQIRVCILCAWVVYIDAGRGIMMEVRYLRR